MKPFEKIGWLSTILILASILYIQATKKTPKSEHFTINLSSDGGSVLKGNKTPLKTKKFNRKEIIFFDEIGQDDPLMSGQLELKDMKYMHIPKTTGTVVEKLFRERYNLRVGKFSKNPISLAASQGDSFRVTQMRASHCSFWNIPTRAIFRSANSTKFSWGKKWLSAPKFTVVRHPIERLLEEYNYIHTQKWGRKILFQFCETCPNTKPETICDTEIFNDIINNMLDVAFNKIPWLRDCHYIPQVKYITDETGLQQVGYVLRHEDLTSQMITFLEKLGYPITPEEITRYDNNKPSGCVVTESQISRKTMTKILRVYKQDFERLRYKIPKLPEE